MGARDSGKLAHAQRTHSIIGGFFEVYRHLGFGYRESVYAAALERELVRRGHRVAREVNVRVYYKGEHIAWERLDMLVDECIIVETKASEILPSSATTQLNNYLGSTWNEVGLLLHFGTSPRFHRYYWPNERKAKSLALTADADYGRQARRA